MTAANRSIRAVGFRSASNLFNIALVFVRTIVLMRLLPVELFGVYAAALAVVLLTEVVPNFGFGAALVNRTQASADEHAAAAVHFTLRLITRSIWAAVLISVAIAIASGPFQTALIVLTAAAWLNGLGGTALSLLVRRVEHERIAAQQVASDITSTVIAIGFALVFENIWALVAGSLGAAVVSLLFFHGWRPVWHPALSLDAARVRYFLSYGRHAMVGHLLRQLLENIDDLWVRFSIGSTGLGFYSRAYQLAGLPRRIVALPINNVALGTFAELNERREALSRAFSRSIGALARGGFLAAGATVVVAPELIRLTLGGKWLPMVDSFRLMLVFSLLDPMRVAIGHLFTGTGRARELVTITGLQVVVLTVLMIPLSDRFGIEGVAVALALSAAAGTVALFTRAQKHVDIDLRRIFLTPSLALGLGLFAAYLAVRIPGVLGEDWRTASAKLAAFATCSLTVMAIFERHWAREIFAAIRKPS